MWCATSVELCQYDYIENQQDQRMQDQKKDDAVGYNLVILVQIHEGRSGGWEVEAEVGSAIGHEHVDFSLINKKQFVMNKLV